MVLRLEIWASAFIRRACFVYGAVFERVTLTAFCFSASEETVLMLLSDKHLC